MFAFRAVLLVITIWTNVSGWVAIYYNGWNLFAVVASDLSSTSWNAQFDADLLSYIFLTGLWIAWRLKFTGPAILMGIFGGLLGNAFLAPYILFLTYKTKGDLEVVLLGDRNVKPGQ